MKIEPFEGGRVRVTLKQSEMTALGLSYEELLLGGEGLQKALGALLWQLQEKTGLHGVGQRVLIEATLGESGGCELVLSGLHEPSRYRIKEGQLVPRLFWFAGLPQLVQGCKAVFTHMSHRIYRSSLYYRGGYILSVTPIDGPRAGAAQLLGEFGGYLGRGELLEELVCEHAKSIRCGDAIDAVSRYL
ncbi:hypothetical protein [Harryflintia acetispora]|uniref:hypothetical protein n=1 Tax=Harryflintia acetispora TaxID=1849041 RepID=UPI00189AE3DB|nr:hypothetical protein [Harryflintia acetispora]